MENFYTFLIIIMVLLISYLIGSIPTAVIVGKVYGIDIRDFGSHNAGGTNVGRVISKKAGILTMGIDVLKSLITVWLMYFVITYTSIKTFGNVNFPTELYYLIAGIGCMIGHCYPIFARFKGGKAVSILGGFILGTNWIIAIVGLSFFFIMAKKTKYISLSSITTAILVSLLAIIPAIFNGSFPSWYFGMEFQMVGSFYYPIIVSIISLFLIFKHSQNIKRLINGNENQLKWGNKDFSK